MAQRPFRTEESLAAELATRRRVPSLLERHGFAITGGSWVQNGIAITQVIEARRGGWPPIRMHVRLCWRRGGRNAREQLYSAAQLRARINAAGWEETLASIASRYEH